jgi:hypothetical protein
MKGLPHMWYNLSLDGNLPCPGYLYKLEVYAQSVTVPFNSNILFKSLILIIINQA